MQRLSPGDWDPEVAREADVHHRGFLIVDGLLSREVDVLGRCCVELLGHGDVMRPWTLGRRGLTRAGRGRLAGARADAAWPCSTTAWWSASCRGRSSGVELFNRGTRRAHHLAVALAIAHHQRVEDRLLLTLWHLAERWGRVHPDGIVLPLPLSHQRLADLVGAHRPSVTTALGDLARAGTVSRRDDGDWVPARLAAGAAAPPPAGGRPQLTATSAPVAAARVDHGVRSVTSLITVRVLHDGGPAVGGGRVLSPDTASDSAGSV